jgi:hypothetical protein
MAKPKAVEIRGYNVGFGDCFLLSFDYGKKKKHVLIDFGTTAAPTGKTPNAHMLEVAEAIKVDCDGHLDGIVETHRHADHISGFATGTKSKLSGDVIRECVDDETIIVQPWTEDPDAPKDFKGPKGQPKSAQSRKAFVAALDNMHGVAESIVKEVQRMKPERIDADTAGVSDDGTEGGVDPALALAAREDVTGSAAGKRLLSRLAFIGEDNVKNLSAVKNLMTMGKAKNHHFVHFGADSGLEDILPGVKVHVLGPPTIAQSNAVLKQRSSDKEEFWMLRHRFWASQRLAAAPEGGAVASDQPGPIFPKAKKIDIPRSSRWFVRRLRGVRAKSLLELVMILDNVLNNTSVILLFEVGGKKLLFPGDAQIENWSYALEKSLPLLEDVDVYKVGHHGSRNATPKTLFDNFKKRGPEGKRGRMMSLISTKKGKHGSSDSHTEVPRATLVKALQAETDYHSTEKVKASEFCFVETIEI